MTNEPEQSAGYVWLDTEYSDLDLDRARLLQVAVIATGPGLNRLLPPERDIALPIRLENGTPLSPWVAEHLPDLVAACRSGHAVAPEEADRQIETYLHDAFGPRADKVKLRPILAGNSVHADWALARRFLPRTVGRLHYRLLDVSALKIQWQDWFRGEPFRKEDMDLVRRHFPGDASTLNGARHDALYDVHASIAELHYYRAQLARQPPR